MVPSQGRSLADGDALLARMGEEIEAQHRGGKGIEAAVRATKLVALADDLLHASRTEEALVCKLEAAGMAVERRRHADPAAILGVELEQTKAVRAA